MFGIRNTRAILNSLVHANPRYGCNVNEASFSALSAKHKGGGTTPGDLSKRDSAAEGSEGGYGGSGISDIANEHKPTSEVQRGRGDGWPGGLNIWGNEGGERRRGEKEKEMEDAAASVAEMAKTGVAGAMETGLKFGEMAKRTMDGVYDATRKTTESVRDSVADDDDSGGNNKGDYRRKPGSDKFVEDLRGRAGGYDLKD